MAWLGMGLLMLSSVGGPHAVAEEITQQDGRLRGSGYSITVFRAIGLDTTLPDLVPRFLHGTLRTEPEWFTAMAVKGPVFRQLRLGTPVLDAWLGPMEWEIQGVRHDGTRSYWEGTAALMQRTKDLVLGDMLAVNVAVGDGASYAATDEANESGSGMQRGQDTYRWLNHLICEAEWTVPSWRHVHLATRIHHRCGVWGVVAPAFSGGNYLSVGLRYEY